MAVRSYAAPPVPRSRNAEPRIDESARVHSFSNLSGDVRIGANGLIAPGATIRADEGNLYIGQNARVQDGAVIQGLQGRVVGDDQNSYSVWIGNNTSITHMALIHGPAYVGDDCFIGFRSTVFNARIGNGCIVMMHALIQDVEIPPGKCVPSGAIITTQQQADRLPNVQERDRAFAAHIIGFNTALPGRDVDRVPVQHRATKFTTDVTDSNKTSGSTMSGEVINHVRQLLAQGYRIGSEHASKRQFQISSWKSCAPIQATNESTVLAELESCLAEHSGEYVRLIGIDTKNKRRVLEEIIQRPGDQPQKLSGGSSSYSSSSYSSSSFPSPHRSYDSNYASSGNGHANTSGLDSTIVAQIRQILAKGGRVGSEHADKRQFQTSSWKSCTPIQSTNESAVIAELQTCLANHRGEYVRLIGIDTKNKRRMLETIIQRPDGKQVEQPAPKSFASNGASYQSSSTHHSGSINASGDVTDQISQLLAQGATIGLEFADERRFKYGSWNSAPTIQASSVSQAIAALNAFLREHSNHYVRLVGVDPKQKKRVFESVIHRPGKPAQSFNEGSRNRVDPIHPAPPVYTGSYADSSYNTSPPLYTPSSNGNGSGRLSNDTIDQIRQLVRQGLRIGVEYADQRRYKTSSWQTATSIQSNRDSDAIAQIESVLSQYPGQYIRLIGIDPGAKRRVAEMVIQQPGK